MNVVHAEASASKWGYSMLNSSIPESYTDPELSTALHACLQGIRTYAHRMAAACTKRIGTGHISREVYPFTASSAAPLAEWWAGGLVGYERSAS